MLYGWINVAIMQQHVNAKLCWGLSSSFVFHNVAAGRKAFDRSVSSECLSVEVCMKFNECSDRCWSSQRGYGHRSN